MIRFLVFLACVAYVVNPFPDFIPDATPFIGTVDDGLAGGIAMLVVRSYFGKGE